MLGLRPGDLDGRPIVEVMGEQGLHAIMPHVQKVLQGAPVQYEADVPFAGLAEPRRLLVAAPSGTW